jgi:AraC family transcriptional regulator
MDVKIVNFEETKVAALEHCGPPEQVNDSARTFILWHKESKLSPVKTSKTYGIAYDDPDTAEPEAFRFDICGSVTTEVPANLQGAVNKVIPGGRCAVIRHLGSHNHHRRSMKTLSVQPPRPPRFYDGKKSQGIKGVTWAKQAEMVT